MDLGGQKLRVNVRGGDGTRPPLLLANGAGAGLEALQPLVDALDERIEVIRFDVPGVGGSSIPTTPYRLPGMARMLRRMLDELNYDEVNMMGFSWGSALAQQFARQNPAGCRRVILASASMGSLMVPPTNPSLYLALATPRRFHDPVYAAKIASVAYGGTCRTDPQTILQILHSPDRTFGGRRGYYYQLIAGAGWTSAPWIRQMKQPTLILAGDDDPIIPLVNGKIMQRLLPNARLHIYHGGHAAILTEPETLAPAVSAFLLAESDRSAVAGS